MRIVYVTDPHVKARNPISRTDDYPAAILRKFLELQEIVTQQKAYCLLIGGDLFDTPKVALEMVGAIARILKTMPCPVYVVPGSHDVFGYNTDTLGQTVLGILERTGVVKIILQGETTMLYDDVTSVFLTAVEHHAELDKRNRVLDYSSGIYDPNSFSIRMVHGMLVDKPFHPDVPHTVIDDIVDVITDDVLLTGHYHPGWGMIEKKGKFFVNPGSMGRLDATTNSLNRMPAYAVLDLQMVNGKKQVLVGIGHFQTAEPGDQVLDRSRIENKKAHNASLDQFTQLVTANASFKSCDVHDVLNEVANNDLVDEIVRATAVAAIGAAESASDDIGNALAGYKEKVYPISAKWLRLKNFQSHKDTLVEFDEHGLNAIIGGSNQGKTAVIRGFRFAFYNEPSGAEFIRTGSNSTEVEVGFSDGSSITRDRSAKSAGTWTAYEPNKDPAVFKSFGANIPMDILNTHQMPKVTIAKDKELSLNIAYQLDGPFLLSESPAVRASAIGRLTGVQYVDAAIKEISRNILNANKTVKDRIGQKQALEDALTGYDDLPEKQKQIETLELLIGYAEAIEREVTEIKEIEKKLSMLEVSIHVAKSIAHICANAGQALALLDEADQVKRDLAEVKDAELHLWRLDTKGHAEQDMLCVYCGTEKALELLEQTTELQTEVKEIEQLRLGADTVATGIGKQRTKLDRLKLLPTDQDPLLGAEELLNEIEAIECIQGDLVVLSVGAVGQTNKIASRANELQFITERYGEVLKAMGKCPVCYSPIDDTVVNNIVAGISSGASIG